MNKVAIKRVYESFDKEDGFRILVDRLWPRGISKEKAKADSWLKEIAPSNELRKWFNHEPGKWKDFVIKYKKELKNSAAVNELEELVNEHKNITLLFGASDTSHNNAVVLKDFIEKKGWHLK